ncbi:MAG: DUF4124 domain-containing protein [Gammaproteobacteria bacterium]|nr:DUF4124 domain-containing protein [Gammaproteobacteria bacterium]
MLYYRLGALIAGILLSATIQAGVYRWVDENGVTVYSQVPPPAAIEKKQMETQPPPPNTEQEAWEEVNQDWKKMRDRQDLLKEQATADSENAERAQAGPKNCDIARRTIEQLKHSYRKVIKNADGNNQIMPTAERRKQLDKAYEMEEKFCE